MFYVLICLRIYLCWCHFLDLIAELLFLIQVC